MKKIITILMVLAISMSLNAANKSKSTKDKLAKEIKKELEPRVEKSSGNYVEGTENTVKDAYFQTGGASFYGGKWNGRRTASGEIFNTSQMTAAHKTLPFGTKVRVTNLSNGKSVVVKINDRGPFIKGRVIDLSHAAFSAIENVSRGVAKVKLEILK